MRHHPLPKTVHPHLFVRHIGCLSDRVSLFNAHAIITNNHSSLNFLVLVTIYSSAGWASGSLLPKCFKIFFGRRRRHAMCMSVKPAKLRGTTIYLGLGERPNKGRVVVCGYENTVQNLSNGGNAMVLLVPSRRVIGPESFLDLTENRRIMKNLREAVFSPQPTPRGLTGSVYRHAAHVQVFEHDIYTIVSGDNAEAVGEALSRVDAAKRPPFRPEYWARLQALAGRNKFIVACFNNQEAQKAAPFFFHYRPYDWTRFAAPAIDDHTGSGPDLSARVDVDHTLILGSTAWKSGKAVRYSEQLPPDLGWAFPENVVGVKYSGQMPNGDFIVPASLLSAAEAPSEASLAGIYRGLIT